MQEQKGVKMSGILDNQNRGGSTGVVVDDIAAPNFIGMVQPFAMSTAPKGWLLCDGASISRATYVALFTAIGTTWGTVDGNTFNVPKLDAMFLRGAGTHTAQMGNTNVFNGGNVGATTDDVQQDFQWASQTATTKVGGPQHQSSYAGREIGQHGMAYRTGSFYYDHTQGGTSQYMGQWNFNTSLSNKGGTGTDSGGDIRQGAETKPFSAAVEYMIKY
jgi:hypothetical protein